MKMFDRLIARLFLPRETALLRKLQESVGEVKALRMKLEQRLHENSPQRIHYLEQELIRHQSMLNEIHNTLGRAVRRKTPDAYEACVKSLYEMLRMLEH